MRIFSYTGPSGDRCLTLQTGNFYFGTSGYYSSGTDDAKIASRNLSKSADNFEIDRRIVFYNGITDSYMLTIEGKCSIEDQKNQLEVTCNIGHDQYKKHFLGLSDNVTYFAEQLKTTDLSVYHHRVTFNRNFTC